MTKTRRTSLREESKKSRAARLLEFNDELGRRLESLDRGESVDPATARARLRGKSRDRRQRR